MYKQITECRCCGSDQLYRYLDLGNQPLANSYHKGEKLERFPLEVNLCEKCFHSQLSVVVEPSLMFQHYLYVSGTTYTFRNHCEELAKDAVGRIFISNPKVLDIACNDGTLLGYFRDLGCEVQGVDPAENLRKLTEEKNIPVEVGYWGTGVASRLKGKYDIITGTNVFAHVNDVSAFLNECLEVLASNGTIILEFPYCNEMIAHCEFDTIYHEHLSYFLVSSMMALADKKGLEICDIKTSPIHGGSIRFFLSRPIGNLCHCDKAVRFIDEEHAAGLLSRNTYVKFGEQVEKNKADTVQMVQQLQAMGKRVIGYGASAKGNTMLNYFGLDLDYIVDDNEMKWGYMTPGQDIVIKSPQDMAEEDELYIVILAWNFYDEIVKKIESICGKEHHYIRYVPRSSCT